MDFTSHSRIVLNAETVLNPIGSLPRPETSPQPRFPRMGMRGIHGTDHTQRIQPVTRSREYPKNGTLGKRSNTGTGFSTVLRGALELRCQSRSRVEARHRMPFLEYASEFSATGFILNVHICIRTVPSFRIELSAPGGNPVHPHHAWNKYCLG